MKGEQRYMFTWVNLQKLKFFYDDFYYFNMMFNKPEAWTFASIIQFSAVDSSGSICL